MLGELSRPSYWTGYHSSDPYRSKTGSIALRLADVHPPNTVATLSCLISLVAFSAKVGQSDAPSSTTGTSFLPSTPPARLISSTASSSASRTVTSLMAMVPLSEWRMPTLISSWAAAVPDPDGGGPQAARVTRRRAGTSARGVRTGGSFLPASCWKNGASAACHGEIPRVNCRLPHPHPDAAAVTQAETDTTSPGNTGETTAAYRPAMRLTPHEQERLLIHVAAGVARERRARGLRLNHPEATAVIASFLMEGARDGRT